MISKQIEKSINKQINAELYSSYLYLSMSSYFESLNLSGFASWMQTQAQEEMVHAMKFYKYLNERGGRVELSAIEAPPKSWDGPLNIFETAYEHETKVTGMINDMMDLSINEKDHATQSMLKWFVDEQVEEEASADAMVQKLKLVKDAPGAIFLIDQEAGARPPLYTLPAAK